VNASIDSPKARAARPRTDASGQVAEPEGKKATGVDERCEDDRPVGDAQRVTQRPSTARPSLLEEVIEEMIDVLRRAEHRRGDQIVAMLSCMPVSRMIRNIARMAKIDGIMAISRAVPLRRRETPRRY
jgi:hypothetical protein